MTTTPERRTWWQALGSLPFVVFVLVACNALYISLVAFGNITDYDTNYAFVQHVLSMDTTNIGGEAGTGLDPDIMWRAITEPVIWNIGYIGIIVWESVAGVVLIAASILWLRSFAKRGSYETPKALSTIGLLMIVLLFFAGFIAIGGEWFQMWQSQTWNGQEAAFRFIGCIGLVLIFLTQKDDELA